MNPAQQEVQKGGVGVAEKPSPAPVSVQEVTAVTTPEAVQRQHVNSIENSVAQALPEYNPALGLIPTTEETPLEIKGGLKEVGAQNTEKPEVVKVAANIADEVASNILGREEQPLGITEGNNFRAQLEEREAKSQGTVEEQKKGFGGLFKNFKFKFW